jgi:hypothetical protein
MARSRSAYEHFAPFHHFAEDLFLLSALLTANSYQPTASLPNKNPVQKNGTSNMKRLLTNHFG